MFLMGVHATVIRPLLALTVIALAALLLSIPARAGGGDPIAQMQQVVQHMENAMGHVAEGLADKLEDAETPEEQWVAYIDCVNELEYYRDYKLGAIEDIADGDPELQEAVEHYQSIVNSLADETLQELSWMYENAAPPGSTTSTTSTSSTTTSTTSTTVPESSTTTHHSTTTSRPRNTTTTNPHQATTTTTAPSTTTTPSPTTTPAPPPTVPPTSEPATSSTTTTTVAPPTTEFAAPPPPPPSTTTTVPSLFDGGRGAVAFSQINESLGGDEIETIDAQARAGSAAQSDAQTSESVLDLAAMTAFQAQEGLMDGTLLMVDYVGSTLPAPVAAPVISLVAIIEMIARALLSGTQAFIGPSLVFGIYVGYRSLVTFVAHRRRGVAV